MYVCTTVCLCTMYVCLKLINSIELVLLRCDIALSLSLSLSLSSLQEMLPTSVFKIYNSSISSPVGGLAGGDVRSKDESNVFTWAEYQLVSHDHSYCSNNNNDQEEKRIHIDHGDPLTLNNVQW